MRSGSGFLSPPMSANRRRSSVMFNEYVILHTPQSMNVGADGLPDGRLGKCSEKMTQTSDGNIWQVSLPNNIGAQSMQQLSDTNLPNSQHSAVAANANPNNNNYNSRVMADCSDLNLPEAMTCQELLAFSVAFSAALPTGHMTLESFYTSLARNNPPTSMASNGNNHDDNNNSGGGGGGVVVPQFNSSNNNVCEPINGNKGGSRGSANNNNLAVLPLSSSSTPHPNEDFSCCYELYQGTITDVEAVTRNQSKFTITLVMIYQFISKFLGCIQRQVKKMVEHKYFQQGILLAILINTLSMGIEYHDQPPELTIIVEMSNVVFSAIFAVEMLLKIVAEGPFRYIANGFNVFDGVIVILR